MHNAPQQPLDELETLRSDVRRLHSYLTEAAMVAQQLRDEKQRLWDALRSAVNFLEMEAPTSEYRQRVLSDAHQALWPDKNEE